MSRRGSAGATLFALENEFSMLFGRSEICSEVHIYMHPIFPAKRVFAVVPFRVAPCFPSSGARLLRGQNHRQGERTISRQE